LRRELDRPTSVAEAEHPCESTRGEREVTSTVLGVPRDDPRARRSAWRSLDRAERRQTEPMDDESTGGEAACWAHLLCEECGVMSGEPHRAWCSHCPPVSEEACD
jgi:hypothetical protein